MLGLFKIVTGSCAKHHIVTRKIVNGRYSKRPWGDRADQHSGNDDLAFVILANMASMWAIFEK